MNIISVFSFPRHTFDKLVEPLDIPMETLDQMNLSMEHNALELNSVVEEDYVEQLKNQTSGAIFRDNNALEYHS